jgi:putative nucleotidyltransferase with HDIG domain
VSSSFFINSIFPIKIIYVFFSFTVYIFIPVLQLNCNNRLKSKIIKCVEKRAMRDKMEQATSTIASPRDTQVNMMKTVLSVFRPEDKKDQIMAYLIGAVHHALNTYAVSLLLMDEEKQELYFKGQPKQELKRLNSSRQSNIAGWIMEKGKPIVSNNPEKNADYYARLDRATGFKTITAVAVPLIYEGKVKGVIETFNKVDGTNFTTDDLNTMVDIANMSAITLEFNHLNMSVLDSYKGTVKALVSLSDVKESTGGGHSRRVAEYALMGARELGLSKDEKYAIEYAGLLHDIGKLGIPDEILNKTDALTKEEWQVIRKHSIIGYNMLKDIPFLKLAGTIVLSHHERYDGTGYPHGICGEKIPLGARLISVADAFDYMTTKHNHRPAMPGEKAFLELAKNANTQFCPKALKAFNSGFVRTRILAKKRDQ